MKQQEMFLFFFFVCVKMTESIINCFLHPFCPVMIFCSSMCLLKIFVIILARYRAVFGKVIQTLSPWYQIDSSSVIISRKNLLWKHVNFLYKNYGCCRYQLWVLSSASFKTSCVIIGSSIGVIFVLSSSSLLNHLAFFLYSVLVSHRALMYR